MENVQVIIEKIRKEMKQDKIKLFELGLTNADINKYIRTKYIDMMLNNNKNINTNKCTGLIDTLLKSI